jgi:hypothetical protein
MVCVSRGWGVLEVGESGMVCYRNARRLVVGPGGRIQIRWVGLWRRIGRIM